MSSFFAICWDIRSERSVSTAQQIRQALRACETVKVRSSHEERCFCVYDISSKQSAASLVSFPGEQDVAGAVFGTLFRRSEQVEGACGLNALSSTDATNIVASKGARLFADYWGSYVAFVPTANGVTILADPTSTLPCFYAMYGEVILLFSHLEKCDFIDRASFKIDYDFIAKLLIYDKIQTGQTGLEEVKELLGGHRLVIAGSKHEVEALWDPRSFALSTNRVGMDEAIERIRHCTLFVVKSWAKRFSSISVRLSGGLDSSIVLACLATSPRVANLNAIHHRLASADRPEEDFARLAAESLGVELFTVSTDPAFDLAEPSSCPLSARPHRSFASPGLLASFGGSASDVGDAVFTGQGGDHLFFASKSSGGFIEHLKDYGVGRNTLETLFDSAHLSGTSVWNVLAESLPYCLGKRAESSILLNISERLTSVNRDAVTLTNMRESLPEWVTNPKNMPPGKFIHINFFFHMIQTRELFEGPADVRLIHPLVSQPLVELALGLPTYLLCSEGRDRNLARRAFSDLLPKEICYRSTKGGASNYYSESVSRHRDQICDVLRSGELAKRGIVRPEDVDEFLHDRGLRLKSFGRMALIYYSIEAWLSRWTQVARQ